MISIHVANNKIAVDMFVSAINPQITPHQNKMGINDSLISSIFCCLFDSILARLTIKAKLAKSEGWNEPTPGIGIHRAAPFTEVPFVNV
jgi:hypothetical protein